MSNLYGLLMLMYLVIPKQFAEQYNGYTKGCKQFYARPLVWQGDTVWVTALNSADTSEFGELFTGITPDTLQLEPADFPQDTLTTN